MRLKLMRLRLGLKHHILLLTIIPSLLMTMALTAYFVVSRQADVQNELIRQMSSSIQYLSKSSELGLFTGDKLLLSEISNSIRANEDVKSVRFYNSANEEILIEGEPVAGMTVHFEHFFYKEEFGSQWLFQTPVYSSNIEVADYPAVEGSPLPIQVLGWVQIIADKSRLQEKQRTILLAGAGIGFMGFFLVALLVVKLSNSITLPLEEITKTVRKIELGDFSARVSVRAKGEMNSLVHGINQLSEKVEISNDSLQKKVDTAVTTLTQTLNILEDKNAQLENTGAKLIEANKTKDNFLASISHELRTPLTAILGYSRLLEKEKLQSKQAGHVGVILQASTMLLSLIDNILDFSKLKSESIELDNTSFNLETLLDEVVDFHQPEVDDKDINLWINVDIDVPLDLIGDVFRIKQVVNNLVRNAIKFTTEGAVSIVVSLLPNPNVFGLVFTVKDSGIGMDNVDASHLFKSFSQADSSISRRFGGTGLGLVISKQLVDLLGGEISISSWKGEGTEVVFSVLNIEEQLDVIAIEDTSLGVSDALSSMSLTNTTILVVEDNVLIKQLLITIFESEGAAVISVGNGMRAVKKCQECSFDLVILDYHMPVLDGIEATKLIRKSFSQEELPIFLVTADVLNTNKVDMTGINKLIYKPIDERTLLESAVRATSSSATTISPKKVLDYLPDDVVFSEIGRLFTLLKQASEANQGENIKKYAHEICGIAGPTSKYSDTNTLMRKIEQSLERGNFEEINTLLLNSKINVG